MHAHALLAACLLLSLVVAAKAADQATPGMPPGGDHAPVFDVPRLDKIAIDGKADDWGDGGLTVNVLCPLDGQPLAATDIDGRFRLGWDDRGLLVLATVKDDYFTEDDLLETLWQKDALELYLAERRGGVRLMQAVLAPGMDATHEELRYKLYDHRKDKSEKLDLTITAARTKTNDGYVLEVLLPWTNIGVKPAKGVEVGFDLMVDDRDREGRLANLLWYPGVAPFVDTTRLYSLRLWDKPSAPVNTCARGGYVGLRATRAVVVARKEQAGRKVALLADGNQIAAGTLAESDGWASAELVGAFPPYGSQYRVLDVLLDGKLVESLPLPEVAEQRDRALRRIDVAMDRYLLTSSKLPGWAFLDPVEANNILGPHTVAVAFYDAGARRVASADKPGLYAAVVDIRRPGEPDIRRYHTLLRLPDGTDLSAIQLSPPKLPNQLGIGEAMAAKHADMLQRLDGRLGEETRGNTLQTLMELRFGTPARKADPARTREQLADWLQRSADSAVLLGWLQQLQAGKVDYGRTNPLNWDMKFLQDIRRKLDDPVKYEYYTLLPQDLDANQPKKWPVLISLHGSGGGEHGAAAQVGTVLVKYVKAHPELPFIVIAPASKDWWNLPALDDMYAEVMAKYPADGDRVYLTGLSMGGYGSWQWVAERPDLFAAVAPVCGGGSPSDAPLFKDVPVWAFHGEKDNSVPVARSVEMVDALKQAHGRVRLTIYPGVGHNSWDKAYKTAELYEWMLQQLRGKPAEPPAGDDE